MVYEPFKVRKYVYRGDCFTVVLLKALALKKLVIKLASIHRKSNTCDSSECFHDVISVVKSVQDLIDFCDNLHFLYAYGTHKDELKVCKYKLWRLTDRAYRSSLRHGYNARTFLNGLASR